MRVLHVKETCQIRALPSSPRLIDGHNLAEFQILAFNLSLLW